MNDPREPENLGEHAADQAESSPAERAAWERMTGELRAWANEPVKGPPLDLAALNAAIDSDSQRKPATIVEAATAASSSAEAPGRRRAFAPPALAWNLAAAALLLLAFSQTSFSLKMGNAEWHWGKAAAASPATGGVASNVAAAPAIDVVKVSAALDSIAAALSDHDAWLADLTEDNRRLTEDIARSHEQLVNWQKTESTTRYNDVARLISMIQGGGGLLDDRMASLGTPAARPVNGAIGQ